MKKIAVVTGASSGLGAEFSIQISQKYRYDEIWIIARRKEKLEETEKKIIAARKEQVVRKIVLDLCGKIGVQSFEKILKEEADNLKAKNQSLSIGLLVNNAGFGTYGPFEQTPVEKQMQEIELNCTTVAGICGVSLPYLQKNSVIVNVSSLAAYMPLGNFAVYGATKSFTLNFSLALAAELKDKGIKVSTLCPGSVSTEFANVASNGARKNVKGGIEPEKVVAQCLKRAFSGKKISIYRLKWRFTAFFSRFLGKFFVARYTFKYQKRPYLRENQ